MKKYKIIGLDCANCAQKIEDKLNRLEAVKNATIQFATSTLFIEFNECINELDILNVIRSIEPSASIIKKDKSSHHHDHHEHEECGCGHHHHEHHEHEECGCGHHHHEQHEHEECGCGHHHHEQHEHEECGCGHHHEHHEHEECGCGHHHHEHHEHEECGCGHHHEQHEHEECGCGHHHEHIEERYLEHAVRFNIKGLDCANCAMKVEKKIKELDYVEEAVLNFSTEILLVRSNEDDLLDKLQRVIDTVENGVVLSESKMEYEKPKLFDINKHSRLLTGIIVYIASMILGDYDLSLLGFISAYILIGHEVLLKALRNILRKEIFDENFLMCIATIGAFLIGEYSEAVAVLLFYSVGEIFQSYAVNKTRGSIAELMDLKSDFANVLVDGEVISVHPEDVKIDDVIVVKVGEKVPLDGIVMKGHSLIDTSSLTGESAPRVIEENDEILAGVVNLSEVFHVKVTKHYEDSTVAKILDLMENAASKKAPIERFITRFARVYTPTVVYAAIALAILPMLVFENAVFTDWLYRALTFLVVSCPCALVISIPLGLYASLGKASNIGALIKGGNYLELLKDIDTVVFDKTGTLTKGNFKVVSIHGDDSLLEIAAYFESMSNHPISKSIVNEYKKEIDYKRMTNFKEVPGKGLEGFLDQQKYYLGNKSYIESLNIDVVIPQEIGTVIYLAKENEYLGCIVVADEIKESTKQGIMKLKNTGIKETVMLTGDRYEVAKDVASKLSIDTIYSELLPQDKVKQLELLLEQDKKVAYVGDGINDAPVLARADIGIAMGGVGSDAAIEAADIVLMQDNIETICEVIDISKKTHSVLMQNVIFTLVIKISVLLLTMFGYSNMWMGVFADVGVTLIAILNSMRILR